MSIMILISELQGAPGKTNLNEMKSLSDKQHHAIIHVQGAMANSKERANTAESIGKVNNIMGIIMSIGGLILATIAVAAIVVTAIASVALGGLLLPALIFVGLPRHPCNRRWLGQCRNVGTTSCNSS